MYNSIEFVSKKRLPSTRLPALSIIIETVDKYDGEEKAEEDPDR